MYKADITPGTEYALREKRTPGTPFQRVRVIEHIRRNRWKVVWVDPNPGLVDYVPSYQLIVPWKELKRFQKEEQSEADLLRHNERCGFNGEDAPIPNAMQQVFESVSDEISFYHGTLAGSREAIARLKMRAGMESSDIAFPGYIDSKGELHIPFDEALEIAKKFCAAEPATVLDGVEATEREWSRRLRMGDDYLASLLNQHRASWALIRQWAGHDAAVAQREAEIKRLERLVWDAVYALQKAGLDKAADKLRSAISRI